MDFLAEAAEEDPEAAALLEARREELERSSDAEWPIWSGYVRDAWDALQYDRFIGSMGGIGPIYYSAISQYARDSGLSGGDLDEFATLIRALDSEYMAWFAANQKAEEDAKKNNAPPPR